MQIVICDDDRKMQDILRDKIERSCREMGVVCELTCCSSGGEVLGADTVSYTHLRAHET